MSGGSSYVQTSFLGGFWSQTMQGRTDHPDYKFGMNECLNTIPIETGAAVRRPGFQDIGMTRNGQQAKLIPFAFQQSAPYVLEFTNGCIRASVGGQLAITNDAQTITNISIANPAVIQTALPHGWNTGDQVLIDMPNDLCPLLQNRQFLITVGDLTHFSISDPITALGIDGSTLGWTLPVTGVAVVTHLLELATSYTVGSLSTIRMVQAEKTGIILQGTFAPQVLIATPATLPGQYATFALTAANFLDGPYLDPVKGGALVTPNVLNGLVTLNLSFNVWSSSVAYSKNDIISFSSVNYQSLIDQNFNLQPDINPLSWTPVTAGVAVGPNGFVASDIGRHIRLFSEPVLYDPTLTYAVTNVVAFNGAYWTALGSIAVGDQPGIKATSWAPNAAGAVWTWGKITGLSNIIDRALAGSVNIGDLVENGHLAAAFDGLTSQVSTKSAAKSNSSFFSTFTSTGFVGKNYSGATPQAVASGTLWASSDLGFAQFRADNSGTFFDLGGRVTINLRASQTAPTSGANGILLGTQIILTNNAPANPVTILSNDQMTKWNYIWFEMIYSFTGFLGADFLYLWSAFVAECQFFAQSSSVSGNGVTVQLIGPALLYTTPIRVWRLGLYNATTGYPTCGTYHEGRIWFSGVVPNRIDSSVSNGINGTTINMAPTGPTGAVADNNAITYVFNSDDSNPLFWMKSDERGILCGTQPGEWLVSATANNNILTPTSIQAHRVTSIGCANVEPRRTGLTYTFVQRYKRRMQEYFADVFSGKFSSPNLTEKAKTLTKSGVEEIAYQSELAPITWARTADGRLSGVTYKRESLMSSQGPSFAGWHRHVIGAGKFVEGIALGPSQDGNTDTLIMSSYDPGPVPGVGIRRLSYLNRIFEEDDDLVTDAKFLDDAVEPTSYTVSTTGVTFHGLWALEGKKATVFAGGLDCHEWLVTNGSCTVPWQSDDDDMFTAEYYLGNGVLHTIIGITYTSRGQILRPNTPEELGTRQGPGFGKIRRSDQFGILLVASRGVSCGTSFDDLNPVVPVGDDGETLLSPIELYSALHWDSLADDYSFDSMLAWEITRPYPAIVTAIGGFPNAQDR